MSTATVNDAAWLSNPYTWRNNRGVFYAKGLRRPVFCGIPEPKPKQHEDGYYEDDDDLKGGDRIGFEQVVITPDMVGKTVAVFKNIEIKGYGDTPKRGQILFHNFIIALGGLSEFWLEKKDGAIEVVKEKIDE